MDKRQKITWIRLMRHFLAMKSDIQMLNVKIESCDWNIEPKATPKTIKRFNSMTQKCIKW